VNPCFFLHFADYNLGIDSPLLSDPEIATIAQKYNVSPAAILISYQVNRGCIVLPKSVNPGRIEENGKVIAIAKEDMEVLESMAAKGKQQRVNTPAWGHDLVSSLLLFRLVV
jgi:glycerol 2-dehydrogenase (NADP+)